MRPRTLQQLLTVVFRNITGSTRRRVYDILSATLAGANLTQGYWSNEMRTRGRRGSDASM